MASKKRRGAKAGAKAGARVAPKAGRPPARPPGRPARARPSSCAGRARRSRSIPVPQVRIFRPARPRRGGLHRPFEEGRTSTSPRPTRARPVTTRPTPRARRGSGARRGVAARRPARRRRGPAEPEDPNRTGAERDYSDPASGPLIGEQHGDVEGVGEQQEEVEQRIRTRIGEDPRTAEMPRVNVEVNDGVAELRGVAPSEDAKLAAGEIAPEVEGVREVRNLITVS